MGIRMQDLASTDFSEVIARPRKRLTVTHPGRPHHRDSQGAACRHRGHRTQAGPLLRNNARVVAESAEGLRTACSPRDFGR